MLSSHYIRKTMEEESFFVGAMIPLNALVVGSANGDLRNLCSKVGTINSKHGPFDIMFCSGNFFAKETPIETIDDLLENKLDFPMTTYFIHGDNGVPGIIERTALRKQGEICNNLFYLGTHGVMTTAQSVKVASLSGTFDSAVYEANIEDEEFDKSLLQGRYLKPTVDALIQAVQPISIMDTAAARGVDILLTHEWPAGITQPGAGATTMTPPAPTTDLSASTFSHAVATVAQAAQPRYHFAAMSGQFWERAPYKNVKGAEHATRFIGLGEVGNKNKQRWFYAFNLVPVANASEEVLRSSNNAATTESPLASVKELKRGRDQQDDAGGFFWDSKRVRNEPPTGYVCRRCNQPGHFIKDCTAERQPRGAPEGYICKKCSQPGHFIQDCPLIKEEVPRLPPGYVCNICHKPGHRITDCPEAESRRQSENGSSSSSTALSRNGVRPPRKEKPQAPCWFCLSNPDVDKNLIVSIGTEMYMTMAKGQLATTASSLIPGGGHLLLVTINHYSSFRTVDAEARKDLESEMNKYKDGLAKLFRSKGAAMVTWELSMGGRMQHAHVQIMAVPTDKVQEIENQFRNNIEDFFLPDTRDSIHQDQDQDQEQQQSKPVPAWQDHAPSGDEGFLKIELSDNKIMICPIPERQRVDSQFGRTVLAKALGIPDRANWRGCVKAPEEEREDSQAFKTTFKSYDFTL
ncbi:hypothetical protein BGZ54_004483 [Gamsiella multidivaricata]|nr:hypothetical protein BGZ54_004483 [Gamsiella multidivaricata]